MVEYRWLYAAEYRRIIVGMWIAALVVVAVVIGLAFVLEATHWESVISVGSRLVCSEEMGDVEEIVSRISATGGWLLAATSERNMLKTGVGKALSCASGIQKGRIVVKLRDLQALYPHLGGHPIDLWGADLRGAILRNEILRRVALEGVDLRGADLSGADLYRANLTHVNGHGVNLQYAKLEGANLTRAILILADMTGADLSGASLDEADLSDAVFLNARIDGVDIERAWPGAEIPQRRPLGSGMAGPGVVTSQSQVKPTPVEGDATPLCPYEQGWRPSEEEFNRIIESHQRWLDDVEEGEGAGSRAVLCSADLSDWVFKDIRFDGANLRNADFGSSTLERVSFRSADLFAADFGGAELIEEGYFQNADLYNASFVGATFRNAVFRHATLTLANLQGADLEGADFTEASLSSASLGGANISRAKLIRARLNEVDMSNSTVSDTTFVPMLSPAPMKIRGLMSMTFAYGTQKGLSELRRNLDESGSRELAREVRYVIASNRSRHLMADSEFGFGKRLEGLVTALLFGFTTRWGLRPWRALMQMGIVGGVSAAYYFVFVEARFYTGNLRTGIFRCFGDGRRARVSAHGFAAIGWACYFSLLSLGHLGWKDVRLRRLIEMMDRRGGVLEGEGWVKYWAFVQSAIGTYLFALWAGNPVGSPGWIILG